MLPNGIARISHGLRCFALTRTAASSAPASELRLETGPLNAIAAIKKAAPKKKKLDSVNPLLTATTTEVDLEKNKDTLLKATKTKATPKKKKLDLAADSVPDAEINQFPVYSYDHCEPLPTVVYTQHEEEANELIAGLKAGYVL
jgi:hypothetical protein